MSADDVGGLGGLKRMLAGEHTPAAGAFEIGREDALDILSNMRRRVILRELRDAKGMVRTGDLADQVAAVENDVDPEDLDTQQRKRVYVGIYQCHLPRLMEANVVVDDGRKGSFRLAGTSERRAILELLDAVDRHFGGAEA